MERILQRRANQMDLHVCLDTAIVGYQISGFDYEKNALDVIQLLVRYGAKVNQGTADNYETFSDGKIRRMSKYFTTPLFSTLIYEEYNRTQIVYPTRVKIMQYLLDQGADPNMKPDNRFDDTPLIRAASFGRFEMVKLLIERGANINTRLRSGETALSRAYNKGEMEIYNYLKGHGAIEFEQKQAAAPASSSGGGSSSAPSTPAPSVPPAPATPTLQTGRYAASGSTLTMQVGSGMITLYDGVSAVGNGTYRINGNTITITFNQASGVASSLNGRTYSYTITSSTNFTGNGERWDYHEQIDYNDTANCSLIAIPAPRPCAMSLFYQAAFFHIQWGYGRR
jgi:hypothetical protein